MDQNAAICRHVEVVSTCHPPHPDSGTRDTDSGSRSKGRLAMLWGISGTVISALGFIGLSLFDQYNHSLNELQRDIKHFHEVSGNLVKKESLQRCYDRLGECLKELQTSIAARGQMERELEMAQKDRRELEREVQRMRERLALVEGRQSAAPIVLQVAPEKK